MALWYRAPGEAALAGEELGAPGEGQVLVRTAFTALSRGTESLVFHGRVPESERGRMRAPLQAGDFPFPVKYGYAAVGTVEAGPDALAGRRVFVLHPHQSAFLAPAAMAVPLPEALPTARAVLAANAETALNALWDGCALPADRIAVVGAGVVGLLVAAIAARLPGAAVTVVDVDEGRRDVAEALGATFATPGAAAGECDVVFHASASAAGLRTALSLAGFEARVVEMSWYGDRPVEVPLGGAFHSRRLSLVSSQVGQVAPARRPRRTHRERLSAALDLLAAMPEADRLLEPPIPLADLPAALPRLLAPESPGILCQLVDHR